jgi:hypothetical protein
MPILHCYVDDDTYKRLAVAAEVLACDITEMAECAISEAALAATPTINGRPVYSKHNRLWDTIIVPIIG